VLSPKWSLQDTSPQTSRTGTARRGRVRHRRARRGAHAWASSASCRRGSRRDRRERRQLPAERQRIAIARAISRDARSCSWTGPTRRSTRERGRCGGARDVMKGGTQCARAPVSTVETPRMWFSQTKTSKRTNLHKKLIKATPQSKQKPQGAVVREGRPGCWRGGSTRGCKTAVRGPSRWRGRAAHLHTSPRSVGGRRSVYGGRGSRRAGHGVPLAGPRNAHPPGAGGYGSRAVAIHRRTSIGGLQDDGVWTPPPSSDQKTAPHGRWSPGDRGVVLRTRPIVHRHISAAVAQFRHALALRRRRGVADGERSSEVIEETA